MNRLANKPSFKPTMEALETRWCPAATVSPLQNGAVTITGDDMANIVQITQDDNLNRLTVIADGVTTNFASDQVTDVVINLNGGNDKLAYQLGGGSDFVNGKRIKADLGSGNDAATFNFADNGAGGLAKVVFELAVDVQAGAGKDQVDAFFGSVTNHGSLTGNMGYGDDRFNAVVHDIVHESGHPDRPGHGFTIDMEDMNNFVLRDPLHPTTILATIPGGNDDFRVTCGTTGLQQGSGLGVTLKGGDGNDNLQFQDQGELHGVVNLVLDGGNGADVVTADIKLDTRSTDSINAKVLGGNGDDTLGLRISNLGAGTVQGLIDGGDGFDNFNKTLNVTDQNCEIGVFF